MHNGASPRSKSEHLTHSISFWWKKIPQSACARGACFRTAAGYPGQEHPDAAIKKE
jgi:hypothetical protein